MTKALSRDLRDRLIAAVAGGLSCNAAAKFGVAVSTAVRRVHAWRAGDRVTAFPQGDDLLPRHTVVYRDVILAAIEAEAASIAPLSRSARSGLVQCAA